LFCSLTTRPDSSPSRVCDFSEVCQASKERMKASPLSKAALFACLLLGGFVNGNAQANDCSSPSFVTPAAFPVGEYPVSLAVGDFNGDGKLDLATSNQDPGNQSFHSISILLGKGDGTFSAATNYPSGLYPSSIVSVELNADFKIDLVVANNTSPGTLSVFLGNGNGTFGSATTYSTESSPISVAVGDFNEDSKPDLVTANYTTGGTVSILVGKGDGSFHAPTNYEVGRFPESVAVSDFNEDAHLDLVLAKENGVAVLLGIGNGTFSPVTSIPLNAETESVAVGDFNGDKHADVAVVDDDAPGSILVLSGLGNGSFHPATNHATGDYPLSLAVGDYDSDGLPDFAVADDTGISVLLGTSNGTFRVSSGIGAGLTPFSVEKGDFNGDHAPDLTIANYTTNGTVSLLLNTCGTERVELSIVRSNNTATVSWPYPSTGYLLESATNLNMIYWQTVLEAVTTNNAGRWQLTVLLNQSERYFRLHKP